MKVTKEFQFTGHDGAVYALEQGPEPHLFYTGSADKMVALWSLKERAPQNFAIRLDHTPYSLCCIPQKQLLLVGQAQGGIHVIDLKQGKEVRHFTLHTDGVFDIKYSEATGHFYALSADGTCSVWDIEQMALQKHIRLNGKLRHLSFDPDHINMVVSCGDGIVRILDSSSLEVIHELVGHENSVNCSAWHPDGKWLVTGGRDAHIRFWDINNGYKLAHSIPAHNFAIYSIAFSPDQQICATASRDKTAKLWDAESFKMLNRIDKKNCEGHINSVNKLIWSPYENTLLTTGDDRSVIAWKTELT